MKRRDPSRLLLRLSLATLLLAGMGRIVFATSSDISEVGRKCVRIVEREMRTESLAIVFYASNRSGKGGSVYSESFFVFFKPREWKSLFQPVHVECGKSEYDAEWEFDYFRIDGRELDNKRFLEHVDALRSG